MHVYHNSPVLMVHCTVAGLRIGKGEGFADLEWAMMSSMKAVNPDTVVITTVLDSQVTTHWHCLMLGQSTGTTRHAFILSVTVQFGCKKAWFPK